MCLYPRLIQNPKYKPNKKNGGNPTKAADLRINMVPIACGNCIECRRKIANNWKIRLYEELKEQNKNGKNATFVTLTFSNENIKALESQIYKEDEAQNKYETNTNREYETLNQIAKKGVRLFLERWRAKYGKSVKHWLITELGEENERIHIHGLIFTDKDKTEQIKDLWKYGITYIGEYVNEKTINYITKYITKYDNKHKGYKAKILCSKGIGRGYIEKGKKYNKFKEENTRETYKTKQGYNLNLPIYYRNHIFTEEEREKLWIYKINKNERYILNTKYETKTTEQIKNFLNAQKEAQKLNTKLGYGKTEFKQDVYKKLLEKLAKPR